MYHKIKARFVDDGVQSCIQRTTQTPLAPMCNAAEATSTTRFLSCGFAPRVVVAQDGLFEILHRS